MKGHLNMTDVIIIGAGISGMTAAIMSCEHGLSVRLIDKFGLGGITGEYLHPLPVFDRSSSRSLTENFMCEVSHRGIEVTYDSVRQVRKADEIFTVICDGDCHTALCTVIAAGKSHGIEYGSDASGTDINEYCKSGIPGLLLCGSARRESGMLQRMADGIVCADTALSWVMSHR